MESEELSPGLRIQREPTEIDSEIKKIMKRIEGGQNFCNQEKHSLAQKEYEISRAEERIVDFIPKIFRLHVIASRADVPGLDTLKEGKSVLITGAVGTGKSTLAFCLAYQFLSWKFRNDLPKNGKMEYSFYSESEYFARLQDRKNKFEDFEFKEAALKKNFLVFDDLLSRSSGELEHKELLFLVDGRYKWMQPTIYTSNKSLNEIGAFDDRIASRLAAGQIVKTESEKDFRLIKNQ